MKKHIVYYPILLLALILLSGCSAIGNKTSSIIILYEATVILSLFMLILYCSLIHKKDVWFLLLFTSILVVNLGYLSLALSKTLEEALLANRISYLGSVLLPMSMFMIILKTIHVKFPKWIPGVLLVIGIVVFFIAASPGYLDIYYKEVTLQSINGVTTLSKVYGSWHRIYLYYLVGYFSLMIGMIIYALYKKKIASGIQSMILVMAVFINLAIWLLEQLVKIDFEILTISYIISEAFLLALQLLIQESEDVHFLSLQPKTFTSSESESKNNKKELVPVVETTVSAEFQAARMEQFRLGLTELTKTERTIYEYYISGSTTKEIMSRLNIKENTLKYHNKNLYSKLGVSSRKQLMELYKENTKGEIG